jgi:mono/diheme cytochrome c family protein
MRSMKGFSLSLFLVAAAVVVSPPASVAQRSAAGGDAQSGFALAQDVCAECHAVKRGEKQSPHAQAPSFTTIANSPGMNPARLRVWFAVSHRSMPDLHLSEEQSDDLIAYITGLKAGR